jgi:ParB family chromosome partitioning protein
MSPRKNKFGIEPTVVRPQPQPRQRSTGPMGAAAREAAQSLSETTEAKLEQRRQNAEDARAYRAAREAGRVLVTIPLAEVRTDALPRDRMELEAAAASDEMEELKASIRARGQREPIEVWPEGEAYQLKKGWRRLTALGQLLAETGEARFATVVARLAGPEDRIERYVDMVEENVVREDLTFAEMAQVALRAGDDPDVEGDAEAMVGRLYASLHKMKRSNIRAFVTVLQELGGALPAPKAVSRDLGVEVARALKAGQGDRAALAAALAKARGAEDQAAALAAFVASGKDGPKPRRRPPAKRKFEFHVGDAKVTARERECRIVSQTDFTEVPRERLEEAIRAFRAVLERAG